MIIFTSLNYPPLKLGNYNFPPWSYKLGWGLTGLILSGIILYALYALIYFLLVKRKVKNPMKKLCLSIIDLFQSFRALINPERKWGPLLEQDRKKLSYYYGGQQGALVAVLDRIIKRSSSRQTLARSKVSKH